MLSFASVSVCGENRKNSDYIAISEEAYCTCFAIADGKTVPETAEFAVKTIMDDFKKQSEITTATIPDFMEHTQSALAEKQRDGMPAAGCSTAVFLSDGELAVWAHIGDCRIYHLQDNLLYEITPDHSEAYYRYEAGDIRYPKIRTDRTRRNVKHLLGLNQDFKPAYSPPEIIKKEDSFLICTDGFWENIHERQIEKTLKRSKNAQDWLDRMVRIVEKNRERKKYTAVKDDYSAITIKA